MTQLSEVQETLLTQLSTINPFFREIYGVQAIVVMNDGLTVRLHTWKDRKSTNIDITYNAGLDVYQVTGYRIEGSTRVRQLQKFPEVYFDELYDFIQKLQKEA